MWMRIASGGGRDGWSSCRILFVLFLLRPPAVGKVGANRTDAVVGGSSVVSPDHVTNGNPGDATLPTESGNDKCHNATNLVTGAVNSSGDLTGLNHGTYPYPPLTSATFLIGAFTCQPYHGVHINHIYFQLANAFFLLSHLAPSGIHGVLYLRCTLLIGCAFFALWGWAIACWLDAALWNATFVAINFLHICMLLYRLRPVKFSREVEEVYVAVFQPLRVSRHQFKKVLNCMKGIRQLKYQEVYAQEKVTKVDSLSLVLSGKLVVSQNGRALHIVFPHQFLDSPEWFGVSTDEYFQVSITAMEESRILLWHRDKLKLSIITDQFLQAVFDHILGRDVVKKLMQVSETMAASSLHQYQNGQVVNLAGVPRAGTGSTTTDTNDLDTKLQLVVKNTGDGSQGITALINRQLQGLPRIKYYYCATTGDPNAWRLGRIEETDHETPV
ncbi:blood vessel epicardial substance [Neodiprion pinetum]|uniref:Blood vessel epicardial substance n=1 Tax=Neodiprion lecontei TaxID=441921 RepID=A0A6J0CBD9_NEOLC|nr:blood vessel epicardial substance [Neodiprion lecontei]XP_046474922.1 blood vessel epicardial substance-like [Neodiprion pinetum]